MCRRLHPLALRNAADSLACASYHVREQAIAMSTVTVSDKGQVVIPAVIRRRLGIELATKLDFEVEGNSIRVRPLQTIQRTHPEDGYGLLKCDQPGTRRLTEFDVAESMREIGDDRP
jgi:antitoxin PrlF